MRTMRWAPLVLFSMALGITAGCHPEVELPPLPEAKISIIGDRFFDVKALSPERALIIGYRGKILETSDSGRTWNVIQTPTDRALYVECEGRSILRVGGLPELPPFQPGEPLDLMEFAALEY